MHVGVSMDILDGNVKISLSSQNTELLEKWALLPTFEIHILY